VLAVVPALGPLKAELQQGKSAQEQYAAIAEEYQKLQTDYQKQLKDAKTAEERKDAASKRPDPANYAKKMFDIAEKNPKDNAALDALGWVFRNYSVMTSTQDPSSEKIFSLLTGNHAANPGIGELLPLLARNNNPAAEKLLRAVLEKTPSTDAQGQACFALASSLKNQAELAARQKKDSAAVELTKQAETLFDRVVKDFAKVKQGKATLGELAEPELFEIRFLAVGKTAPDITGEDIDGKQFKLSDYRGKVVMLDFWGHW